MMKSSDCQNIHTCKRKSTRALMPGDPMRWVEISIPQHWKGNGTLFTRSDGAAVKWNSDEFYSNPLNPRAKMWEAYEPDPSCTYLKTRHRRSVKKHWFNPERAMAEVDRLFPCKTVR